MGSTLECSSRGDKRFSALYARIAIHGRIDSIENIYQSCKRTSNGSVPGKGKSFAYFVCPYCGLQFPAEDISDLYYGLWIAYFKQNPELLAYAANFNDFHDMFRGKSVNCQADVIKEMVNDPNRTVARIKASRWYMTMAKSMKGEST